MWDVGLRIVDLGHLARQLYCQECSCVLDMNHTREEHSMGLASVLTLHCQCGHVSYIKTNSCGPDVDQYDAESYDINLKTIKGRVAWLLGSRSVI